MTNIINTAVLFFFRLDTRVRGYDVPWKFCADAFFSSLVRGYDFGLPLRFSWML